MTCIVAIVQNENVYMGGDRGVSNGETIMSLRTPKIESRNGWIYGYAGTIGIGQLLSLTSLPEEVDDVYRFIRLELVEALKKSINSFSSTPEEHDTSWLIAKNGRLFELNANDWGVVEVTESSIGSGSPYALGSLYTSNGKDAIERIGLAMGAAITFSPGCQGPIDIEYN